MVRVDKWHRHEAMDRLSMMIDMWEKFIEDHPAIQVNPAVKSMAKFIGEEMGDLYQIVGRQAAGDE